MTNDHALQCLGDATRRQILELLRSGPKSVAALAAELPVTRPAVSQHLKTLKEAGLVNDRRDGTRRVYHIDPDGLGELRRWLDEFWDDALAAYQREVGSVGPTGKGRQQP